jgi:hypothetical protein
MSRGTSSSYDRYHENPVDAAAHQTERHETGAYHSKNAADVGRALTFGIHPTALDLLHIRVAHDPRHGPKKIAEYQTKYSKNQDQRPAVRRITPARSSSRTRLIIVAIIAPRGSARGPVLFVDVLIAWRRARGAFFLRRGWKRWRRRFAAARSRFRREGVAARRALHLLAEQFLGHAQLAFTLWTVDDFRHNSSMAGRRTRDGARTSISPALATYFA